MRHLRLTPEERKIVNRRHNVVILMYTGLIIAVGAWAALKPPPTEGTREARAESAIAAAHAGALDGYFVQ
jgi:hypothetical protein